ncbi:reverse transcriptase domain-containing protein [Tanacetum coccineum]
MMRVTTAFLRGEVAASSRERKKSFPLWKQQKAGQKQNFNKGGFQNQQRLERKQDMFTLLTTTPKEILALDKGNFKPPPPMTTPRQIEEILKAGKLSHLKQWERPCKGSKKEGSLRKGQTTGDPNGTAIAEGSQTKDYPNLLFGDSDLIPTLGEEDGTEGLMIIEAEMGGHFVHRMYVDGGSSSEILYKHCFNRFRLEVRSQMVPAATPLVTISIQRNHRKARSKENPGKTVTLRSSMIILLECIMVSGPGTQQPIIDQVIEEKIQVAIHPEYSEQTIAIGFTLTEDGQKELCGLLRHNLGIFAWKPTDMTGVPRHIAEHRLNIREGCLPVRQKKRGQAPERNKAIYEEVEKLVNAVIMKEDLNKAFPKDGYPLPEIDWKVESLATYQRLMDKAFQKQIGRNLEVYADDLVIKSRTEQEVIRDVEEAFKILREINMKLNPKKCTFGMREGTFLGYKVNADGLKVCPDKVEAVLSLLSPKCLKDVQRLNEKLASLNKFLSKSAKKSLPFFKTLKKCTKKSDF